MDNNEENSVDIEVLVNLNWNQLTKAQKDFLTDAIQAAQACQRRTGVLTSVTVAQALIESGWGEHHIGRANNYFGIKDQPSDEWKGPFVEVPTKEWSKERGYYTVIAKFRMYPNMEASFTDHANFLVRNPRYKICFGHDYRGFAEGLQKAGYATDPEYARKLIATIEKYGLQFYDLKPGQ